jgi:hypothetical protein
MNTRYFIHGIILTALTAFSWSAAAQQPDPNCVEKGKSKLELGVYHLVLEEKKDICLNVDLNEGPKTFVINIKIKDGLQVNLRDVAVTAKDPLGKVNLSGGNTVDTDKVLVYVSVKEGQKVAVGDTIGFNINVKDLGILDPRVRVVGQ